MMLWLLVILWILLAGFVLKSDGAFARGFKPRLVTLLAVILILGSYFSQAWLKLGFLDYLGSGVLRGLVPGAADLIGLDEAGDVLRGLLDSVSLNGWQLQLVPFFDLGTRLAITVPAVIAVMALIWLPWGTSLAGGRLCKIVGAVLVTLSLIAVIGLALALPDIDILGAGDRVDRALLAVLLGVRIGVGAWLTFFGLLLLLVGGLVEMIDTGSERSSQYTTGIDTWGL